MTNDEIKQILNNSKSFNRYGRVGDTFPLTDDYFCIPYGDCLICTDQECDIDADGNICLVLPDKKVCHLGTVVMTEDGSKPSFSFDRDTGILTQKYKVYYDNSHHHAGYETLTYDCNYTKEKQYEACLTYLTQELQSEIKGYQGGRYRNQIYFSNAKHGFKMYGIKRTIGQYGIAKDTDHMTLDIYISPENNVIKTDGNDNIWSLINPRSLEEAKERCLDKIQYYMKKNYVDVIERYFEKEEQDIER